jgi:prepilin-type N-terminal cleavage/methylation domain-containing protein
MCLSFNSRSNASNPRGFTLLELTLVLALLVVITAIIWPAFEKPLASQRLRHAADKVRAEWSRTRIKAMTSGSPHVFRYLPLSNQYQVEIWQGAEAQLEAGSANDFGVAEQQAIVAQAAGEKGLPEGVVFDANQMRQDVRSMFVGADAVQSTTGEAAWSEPIYFYPDGTATTARLLLRNEHELYIILDLRGLTGVTTVSDVMTVDELPR